MCGGYLACMLVVWVVVADILLAAIVVQVGNSLFWVGYPALVHEVADQASQEQWFAVINAMRNAGLAVGALGRV